MSKEIPLTQGKFAIVDDEVFEYLSQWKWQAVKKFNIWYAQRSTVMVNGKRKTIYMHREILKTPDNMDTDHKDNDGLNNRLNNIRICTPSQNQHNHRPQIGKSSRYKGVGWHKSDKCWQSRIKINGKTKYIGNYTDEIEAAKAYDKKAIELFGEFAHLNFKPKCKTCGDSKEIIKEDPDILPVNWTIPCPDCQQPKDQPSSEFTKELRLRWGLRPKIIESKIAAKDVFDLCDRLDKSEASRKKLLDMCKEFMEKADNGSADFDDPEPGSIYLRAEAAIAKAEKEQS